MGILRFVILLFVFIGSASAADPVERYFCTESPDLDFSTRVGAAERCISMWSEPHQAGVFSDTNCQATNFISNNASVYGRVTNGSCYYAGSIQARLGCADGFKLENGTCVSNPCADKVAQGTKYGIYSAPVGAALTGTFCENGCRLALGSTTQPYYTDGKTVTKVLSQTYLTGACTAEAAAPIPGLPGQTPPDPPKKPPCLPTEGVMTSSTGAIHCVPEGIPGSNKPAVTKESNTTKNADGSTTTKETTTTRDPSTGVESKETVTTNRDGSGNVTSSTSDSSLKGSTVGGDPTKPAGDDFCGKNPTLQICKGGMNEETTQKKVQEAAEKIRDSLDAKDFDAATHFKPVELSQDAKTKIDDQIAQMTADIAKFGTSADPSAGFYDNFRNQMTDWIGPISNSGCQPFSGRVGPYTWNLDVCPTAAKISEIGAYCMWVMLAFGLFSLATRNRS